MAEKELLSNCYLDYKKNKTTYDKMNNYYNNESDARKNYQIITDRINNILDVNFIQKFIAEESSYVLGNPITYSSYTDNVDAVNAIRDNIRHWSVKHDRELLNESLKFNIGYELYFIDKIGRFSSIICNPTSCYILEDDFGNIELFIRFYTKRFDKTNTIYADVYESTTIIHYRVLANNFEQIGNIDENMFGRVPVSMVYIGSLYESIYARIKNLQDALQTNMSDNSNEISDFRASYIKMTGCKIDGTTKGEDGLTDLQRMKKLGILNLPSKDSDVAWLMKNFNDSYVQNNLNNIEDKIYQMSSHINYNEKMQSNLSGTALRSRLLSLEMKCKNNIQAMQDCIKNRIEFLFLYLYKKTGVAYNVGDINLTFTPSIPTDDFLTAQMISQLGDKISTKTALSQLSFINNPDLEMKQIEEENQADSIGNDLLTNSDGSDNNATN